ncbi:MAG: hypothetical protein BAJATHORv1_20297 [Candidatus Thorarchaeota archaeon]|nr:MAG: hypothetical protein BAJATHORv1_20297 [Candidatus Thorarchaeota archaeon]
MDSTDCIGISDSFVRDFYSISMALSTNNTLEMEVRLHEVKSNRLETWWFFTN